MPESLRRKGIITYSAGNHGQAIALTGQLLDIPTTVVIPTDASLAKLAGMKAYGANVVTFERTKERREDVAQRLIDKHGYTFIPPFDHEDVITGQGTVAKELIEEVGELDYLCCQVIGMQPELADYAVDVHKVSEMFEIHT